MSKESFVGIDTPIDQREPEIWLLVFGFEDYLVSSWGSIASLKNGKRKVLAVRRDADGYIIIALCKNGEVFQRKVHRLVGIHFVPNPDNLKEINHLYGNKANNYYKDIQWSTRRDNNIHALQTGLKPKSTEKQRAAVRLTNFNKRCTKYKQSL